MKNYVIVKLPLSSSEKFLIAKAPDVVERVTKAARKVLTEIVIEQLSKKKDHG